MKLKLVHNFSLIFFAAAFFATATINSFDVSTEQKNEYHDCDFDSLRKVWAMMGNKEIENLTDNEIMEIMEKMKTVKVLLLLGAI